MLAKKTKPHFVSLAKVQDLSSISPNDLSAYTAVEYECASPEDVLKNAIQSNVKNFISSNSVTADEQKKLVQIERSEWNNLFGQPGTLFTGDFANSNVHLVEEVNVFKRGDKRETLEAIKKKLTELNINSSLITEVCIVADEIVSNAIFNAPFVPLDNHKSGVNRKGKMLRDNITLLAKFQLHVSEKALMITCVDTFGRLNISAFLKRILDCYHQGISKKMNMGEGGAGIGSHMIYNQSMALYLAVHKEKSTCVAASFARNLSAKKRESINKSLHIFEINEGES